MSSDSQMAAPSSSQRGSTIQQLRSTKIGIVFTCLPGPAVLARMSVPLRPNGPRRSMAGGRPCK
eukprot:14289731-Heterocapsa_arctica.AAC.1